MTRECDCCDGAEPVDPNRIANRPGKNALSYRIGNQREFVDSMIARLNQACGREDYACDPEKGPFPLRERLKTRDPSDPTMAMLDASATLLDSLTFYQERIANEGYLGTAQQQRSLHELAATVGYQPRPGLSSSVLLAFEVEEPPTQAPTSSASRRLPKGGVLIPKGTAVESTPASGTEEEPQTFETSEDFIAYQEWNNIPLRRTIPQKIENPEKANALHLNGIGLGIKEGEFLVLVKGRENKYFPRRVSRVIEDRVRETTEVRFQGSGFSRTEIVEKLEGILSEFKLDTRDYLARPIIRLSPPSLAEEVRRRLKTHSRLLNPSSLAGLDTFVCNRILGKESNKGSLAHFAERVTELTNWSESLSPYFNLTDASQAYRTQLLSVMNSRWEDPNSRLRQLSSSPSRLEHVNELEELLISRAGKSYKRPAVSLESDGQLRIVSPQQPVKLSSLFSFKGKCEGESVLSVRVRPLVCEILGEVAGRPSDARSQYEQLGIKHDFQLGDGEHTEIELNRLLTQIAVQSTSPTAWWQVDIQLQTSEGTRAAALCDCATSWKEVPFKGLNRRQFLPALCNSEISLRLGESVQTIVPLITFDGDQLEGKVFKLGSEPGTRVLEVVYFRDRAVVRTRVTVFGFVGPGISIFDSSGDLQILPKRILRQLNASQLLEDFDEAASAEQFKNDTVHRVVGESETKLLAILNDTQAKAEEILAARSEFKSSLDAIARRQANETNPESLVSESILMERAAELFDTFASVDKRLNQRLIEVVQNTKTNSGGESEAAYALIEASRNALLGELQSLIPPDSSTNSHSESIKASFQKLSEFNDSLDEAVVGLKFRLAGLRQSIAGKQEEIAKVVFAVRENFLSEISERVTAAARENGLGEVTLSPDFISSLRLQVEANGIPAITDLVAREAQLGALAREISRRVPDSATSQLARDLRTIIKEVAPNVLAVINTGQPESLGDIRRLIDRFVAGDRSGTPINRLVEQLMSLESSGVNQLLSEIAAAKGEEHQEFVFQILRNIRVTDVNSQVRVFRLPTAAQLFGWNAPDKTQGLSSETQKKFTAIKDLITGGQNVNVDNANPPQKVNVTTFVNNTRKIVGDKIAELVRPSVHAPSKYAGEQPSRLFLDGPFAGIKPGDPILVQLPTTEEETSESRLEVLLVGDVKTAPRTAYDLRGVTTAIDLLDGNFDVGSDMNRIRNTRIFCEAIELELAERPYDHRTDGQTALTSTENLLVCDGVVANLVPGQKLVVSGRLESNNLQTSEQSSETVVISSVIHTIDKSRFGDRYVTQISVAGSRNTELTSTSVFANLVEATHGKTIVESLGDGRGTKAFAKYPLSEFPISRVPVPTADGVQQELKTYVNDVRWEESESFLKANDSSEHYVTRENSDKQATVIFGDGVRGARPPTGVDNIAAEYRVGLGVAGNVAAQRIDQISGSPIGVKSVSNPMAASGGANPDGTDDTRFRIPLSVMSFDRLVSVRDYEDFALNYAGIGKAKSLALPTGNAEVQLTIAANHPGETPASSQLYRNLLTALKRQGGREVLLLDRIVTFLILFARVKIDDRYKWEVVERELRSRLFDLYSYERAQLGGSLFVGDAIAQLQDHPGVRYVQIEVFDKRAPDDETSPAVRNANTPQESPVQEPQTTSGDSSNSDSSDAPIRFGNRNTVTASAGESGKAAEICFLNPKAPGALILEQLQ